jgi:hypothetical protein
VHDRREEHPDAPGDLGHLGHDGQHFFGGEPVGGTARTSRGAGNPDRSGQRSAQYRARRVS